VHSITTTVLNGITFDNKKLEFVSAYSGTQARQIMQEQSDIALILLDVVMEEDNAGLEFVDFVRNELNNQFVRIVLRTGQPGYAPEKEVIEQYDINDYKEKTELTAQKLYTTVITSLRNYKELLDLQAQKVELKPQNNSTMYSFAQESLNKLIETINETKKQNIDALVIEHTKEEMLVLAATKKFASMDFEALKQQHNDIALKIDKSIQTKSSHFYDEEFINFYEDETGNESIVYITSNKSLNQNDIQLIEMFSFNISSAFLLYK
jgi:CheY-like chemotaxis protein